MNSLQKEGTKFLTDGRKLHQQFLALFGITGIILTVADIVSDIVLAEDYCPIGADSHGLLYLLQCYL